MTAILEVDDVTKTYGATKALKGVSFSLSAGRTLAVVGDNGAGKSTLVKILTGMFAPSTGGLRLDGEPVTFSNPRDAHRAGIEAVFQDLALVPNLDVAGNFFLRRELVTPSWLGPFAVVRKRKMARVAKESVSELHIRIPGIDGQEISKMSGGQRQCVAIARAAYWARRVLILDEPTAALGVEESGEVLRVLNTIKRERNIGQLVISHNMEHVWAVADDILVLRQGSQQALLRTADTTPEEVVGLITGAHVVKGNA
ncbi:sugar ABC transporter ATP-binding protein [Actinoplanes sp. LDG1-06]|uniref:Sugar ABC transporter ATP-binding protein n=1 Tax=Paractinoplanes ovalisporus TaxID=2810368 RepID=A0ABS2A769_9ACTN|nr:ATP-binding cassette domain-containing protein [Actinoplanes ovalisporus]MBM2615690.1 sugar ABC transporter ATP-binding protein [Actinoplanes ovalisporus]